MSVSSTRKYFLFDLFMAARAGLLGTDSVRKVVVTFARGTGCTKVSCGVMFSFYKHVISHVLVLSFFLDDTDYQGHWKNSWRQHETYADTDIGWVDAKVTSWLC